MDHSHERGWEASGDCGRVVTLTKENGVSKSSGL